MATYEDINQRTPLDIIRERMVRPPPPVEPVEPDLRTQKEIEEASKPYIRPNVMSVRGFKEPTFQERVVPLIGPNEGPPTSAMMPKADREAQNYTRPPYTVPANRSDDFQAPASDSQNAGSSTGTPVSFPQQPISAQRVPSLRDQINEGIMRDFDKGIDRGLPYIGGDNGKIIQSFASAPGAPVNLDDPRQQRLVSIAHRAGVDPALMLAIAGRESGFNQNAVGPTTRSGARAMGDMQVMPSTFNAMNQKYGGGKWSSSNPDDLTLAGAHYLADMMRAAGGDPFKSAVAYFGGPGNLQALAAGQNRTDGAPGRAGTSTTSYAQSIADRYAQFTGGQSGPFGAQSSQTVAESPSGAGPLRQPVEIIRGLMRTAFDPYTQREFNPAPPGLPADIAPLLNLPPQLAAALISERGGLARERIQQSGALERAGIQERGAAERTRMTTEASGDQVNRVTGRALAELIQGKPPEEQLKIIQKMTRGDKDRFQVITVPDREVQTGNPLDPIKIARGGQYIRDNQTGEFFSPPQASQGGDKKAIRAEAEAAIKNGKSKEAVNARLKELGIQPL